MTLIAVNGIGLSSYFTLPLIFMNFFLLEKVFSIQKEKEKLMRGKI